MEGTNNNNNNNIVTAGSTSTSNDHLLFNGSRFPSWIGLFVFSIVCLAAEMTGNVHAMGRAGKWTLIVTLLSILSSIISIAGYVFIRDVHVGQISEIVLYIFVFVLWSTGVPVIMNPEHEIAVVKGPVVDNANLYFFTWFSFIIVLSMSTSILHEVFNIDYTKVLSRKVCRWYGLVAASIIVSGSSTRILRASTCNMSEYEIEIYLADNEDHYIFTNTYCKRTRLAIAMGILSFFMSATIAIWMSILQHHILYIPMIPSVEMITCTICMILWCFGIAYLTFGDITKTPGSTISNLYFATWTCFTITVLLFTDSYKQYFSSSSSSASAANGTTTTNNEQQMTQIEQQHNHNHNNMSNIETGTSMAPEQYNGGNDNKHQQSPPDGGESNMPEIPLGEEY